MNETDIRKYAELMKEFDLTGLEINAETGSLRLERAVAAAPVVQTVQAVAPSAAAASASAVAEISEGADAQGLISVRSPMVGVFYASPAENAEPFVSVGTEVKPGDTLCIIEAMKLMNELAAEQSGVIAEICVKNGQVVDYGCELFRLRRA